MIQVGQVWYWLKHHLPGSWYHRTEWRELRKRYTGYLQGQWGLQGGSSPARCAPAPDWATPPGSFQHKATPLHKAGGRSSRPQLGAEGGQGQGWEGLEAGVDRMSSPMSHLVTLRSHFPFRASEASLVSLLIKQGFYPIPQQVPLDLHPREVFVSTKRQAAVFSSFLHNPPPNWK